MALNHLTEFDELVKSTLDGIEESVPSSVWEHISDKLDALAGAAAAGTAISSASGSAAGGSVAAGSSSVAGGTAAGSAAAGTAAGSTAAGTAGSAAAGTAAGAAATAASSNALTIALASVATVGVIGGGAALVLNNSNNQHIEEPELVTEVVQDTASYEMPEDTLDLVQYIRHVKPVIDEAEPVQDEQEISVAEVPEETEPVVVEEPAPVAAPAVQWTIQPERKHSHFAISAGYLNSMNKRSSSRTTLNGFYVGMAYNLPVYKSLGVSAGVYYSFLEKNNVTRWAGQTGGSSRVREQYLFSPVHLNYAFRFNDNFALRVFGGPTFAYGLSSNRKFDYEDTTHDSYDGHYTYKRFNLMLGGGLSVELWDKISVNAGFDQGILNRRSSKAPFNEWTSQLHVGVSWLF